MVRSMMLVSAGLLTAGCATGDFYKTDLLANDIADFSIAAGDQARIMSVDGTQIHPRDSMIRVKEGKHEFKAMCKMGNETVERTVTGKFKAGKKYVLKIDNKKECWLMVAQS